MAKHWIQEWLDWLSAVPIPSRCPITGLLHCERKDCRYYLYSDDARDLGERCAHPDAVAAVVDPGNASWTSTLPPPLATGTAPSN